MSDLVTDIVILSIVVVVLVAFVALAVVRWRGRSRSGDTPDPRAEAARPDQRQRPGDEYRPIADTKASGGGGLGL